MDPVDGEVAAGAEDVEVAGQHQLQVVVAGEAALLEVHHETMRCEEVSPQDGLPYLATSKSQGILLLENCKGIILEL